MRTAADAGTTPFLSSTTKRLRLRPGHPFTEVLYASHRQSIGPEVLQIGPWQALTGKWNMPARTLGCRALTIVTYLCSRVTVRMKKPDSSAQKFTNTPV